MTSSNGTVHVLLVYSLVEHKLIRQDIFDTTVEPNEEVRAEVATDAYFEAEQEFRENSDVEIVLIGADSLDTIKKTHSSYFQSVIAAGRSVQEALKERLASLG